MTRRTFAQALTVSAAFAQPPLIPIQAVNHATLTVTDVPRSLHFYQRLFGLPIQARQGPTVLLRIGVGPQFLALHPGNKPAIGHFCLTTDTFDVEHLRRLLAANKVRVRMRPADLGGAPEGTAELYFADPDGLSVQLQHTSYCGGAGLLGDQCPAQVEQPPTKGLLALESFHHFLLHVSDEERSRAFYNSLFAETKALLFARDAHPSIAHVCFATPRFDANRALSALTEMGIRNHIRINGAGVTFPDPDGIRLRLV